MGNSLGIDPKKFKHVKSDDKSTTLQHKDGHTLTIAHNVLNPKMKEQLLALAKVPQEPKKMANGGEAPRYDNYQGPQGADPRNGDISRDIKDRTTPEQDKERHAKQDANAYHAPADPKEDNSGYTDYAKGGDVSCSGDKKGISTQGEIIRNKESKHQAKAEASGRADMERHVKPKIKGLAEGGECYACGGKIHKYAEGEEVKKEEKMLDENGRPADMPSMPASPDQVARPDMAPPAAQSNQPQAEAPPSSVGEAQMTPIQPEEAPQDVGVSDDEIKREAEGLKASAAQPQQQQAAPIAPAPTDFDHIPATAEPMPEPGQPMSARQQAIFQVQNAKATQEQHEENQKFAQDIQNGHISPKTYSQLFHDRSTPGKIGMIFGLALSGMGSGMAHQQNAYLNMMDKTISNDLEAQKQSKTNANNFVKLNVENELNHANTQLTKSQAGLTDQNANLVKQNAIKIGLENSTIQVYTTAMKQLMDVRNKTAEGTPERAAADTALSQFFQRFGDKITSATAAVAGAKAQNAMLYQEPGTGTTGSPADRSEQAFQQHQVELLKQAQFNPQAKAMYDINESKHISGIPGMASAPIPQPIRDRIQNMNILDNKVKDVIDYAQKHKGSVNPQVLRTAKQKAEELTSFYNGSLDSLGMSQGRLSWLEEQIKKNPTSLMQQILGNNATLREIRDSNSNRRDQILHGPGGLGFPKMQDQQQPPQYKTDANGVKWMRGPNGEAIKVK